MSERKVLFLPSCRPALMRAFLDSLDYLPGWDVLVAFQAYDAADWQTVRGSRNYRRIVDGYVLQKRTFPHPTRVAMLQRWGTAYDVWCSVDDDMEYLPTVDYDSMLAKLREPGVGVISGNWVRSEAFLTKRMPVRQFVKQPIVNMAGGMMYGRNVVDAILAAPAEPYLFCDVHVALTAYLAGYENFRWRGSLIIHRIMQKDGLQRTFRQYSMTLPDPAYMTVKAAGQKYTTDNNWHMPDTSCLTPAAHATHKRNRAALGL